jgi:hypothetical protein
MAEIRSTLDMVMERAARMAAEAEDTPANEDTLRKGMRLAAAYLNNEESDLIQLLESQPAEERMEIRGGIAKTLLRNITLPREESLSEVSLLSLKSLQELSGNSSDVSAACAELKQILEQYGQHKVQVKQQFDESILGQLKMKMQEQGMPVDDEKALNPTMHPQYQEEWSRVTADLNNQYNAALDQRKELIAQGFGV